MGAAGGCVAGILQQAISIEPDKAALKFNLANLFWEEGRQAAAIDLVGEIVADNPQSESLLLAAARFLMSKKLRHQAARLLENGAQSMPRSVGTRIALGEVYLNQNNPRLAVQTLEKCLELNRDPAAPEILKAKNALAKVHLMLRETELAEPYIQEVLSHDPQDIDGIFSKNPIGYLRLGALYHLQHKPGDALNIIESGYRQNPLSAQLLTALIQSYMRLRKPVEAAAA